MWRDEKAGLLRTHPGWYVAYLDGKRVALEPTVGDLEEALDRKLGSPRPPCECHQVVAVPPRWPWLTPAPLLEGRPPQADEGSVEPRGEPRRDAWQEEKPALLRTHRGWYVAYLNGERVALEPTLGQMEGALTRKLGSPRPSCEFHHIVEVPPRFPGLVASPLLPDRPAEAKRG